MCSGNVIFVIFGSLKFISLKYFKSTLSLLFMVALTFEQLGSLLTNVNH